MAKVGDLSENMAAMNLWIEDTQVKTEPGVTDQMSTMNVQEVLFERVDLDISRDLRKIYAARQLPWEIRRRYATWLESSSWVDVRSKADAAVLYDELIHRIDKDINMLRSDRSKVLDVVELYSARDCLEEVYRENPESFVQNVCSGLSMEKTIIYGNRNGEKMEEEAAEEKVVIDKYKEHLEALRYQIQELTQVTTSAHRNLQLAKQKTQELTEFKNDIDTQLIQPHLNGHMDQMKNWLDEKVMDFVTQINGYTKKFLETKPLVKSRMERAVEGVKAIISEVDGDIAEFKHLQKLAYVRAAPKPDIKPLEQWCGDIGKSCWNLIQQTKSPELNEVMSSNYEVSAIPTEKPRFGLAADDSESVKNKSKALSTLLEQFIKDTFIVTEQPPEVLKMVGARTKGQSREFGAKVSILALSCFAIEEISSPVIASFHSDAELANERKIINCQLNKNKVPLRSLSEQKSCEACFTELQVKEFSRGRENDDGRVSKQFFRVVFSGKVKMQCEWEVSLKTMSLPIVVNTGSNQACEALGSLLWYCYNTEDVYANLNKPFLSELPLSAVLEMLNACLKALSPRQLEGDERKFLAEKLTGQPFKGALSQAGDPKVTFSQFCVSKMRMNKERNVEFTFWKWFQAILNLIEKYLSQPWKDGVIKGFVSKTKAGKVLAKKRDGTFLIRFSESCVIGDHQGVTGGFVVGLKYQDTVTFSPPQTEKELSVMSLSQVLNRFINQKNGGKPLLQILYPQLKSRDEAFDRYNTIPCEKKGHDDSGYPGWLPFLGLDPLFSGLSLDDPIKDNPDETDPDIWTVPDSTGIHKAASLGGPTGPKIKRQDSSPGSVLSYDSNQSNSSCSGVTSPPSLFTKSIPIPTVVEEQLPRSNFQKLQDYKALFNSPDDSLATYSQQQSSSSLSWNYACKTDATSPPLGQVPQSHQNPGVSSIIRMGTQSNSPSSTSTEQSQQSPSRLSPDLEGVQPMLFGGFVVDQGQVTTQDMNIPVTATEGFMELLQNSNLEQTTLNSPFPQYQPE